jgi:predicted metal-dependent peptidase/intein/homing endonuclease
MEIQQERFKKCLIKLQGENPFFSYLSLFLTFIEDKNNRLPDYAGMGVNEKGELVYKKDFVDKLNDKELLGVILHELCLTPNSLIAGKEFKKIKDIKKDDLIINQFGKLEKVIKVFKRKINEDIYNIRGTNLLSIKTTKEHPFLVKKYFKSKKIKRENRGLKKQFNKIRGEWVNAKDLKLNDLIAIPKIKGEINIKKIYLKEFYPQLIQRQTHILDYVNLNKDVSWLLGLYVADGSMSERSLRFNLNNYNKNKYFKKIQRILRKEFKINKTNIFQVKKSRGKILSFCSIQLAKTFSNWCGENAKNKKIPYFILYNKDKEILKSFLNGYSCGDGFYYKKQRQLQFSTISKKLAQQIQLGYLRFGKLANVYNYKRKGVYHRLRGRELKNLNNYQITIKDNSKLNFFIDDKNCIWTKIKKIKKEKYKGFVYNFETEKTHTYTSNNYILHNCHLSLLHLLRLGNRNQFGWNLSADIVVNSLLTLNNFDLPKESIIPNYKHDIKIGNKTIEKCNEKTAEQIYDELPKEYKQKSKGVYVVVDGDGNEQKGFDEHSFNELTPQEKQEIKEKWEERVCSAYISCFDNKTEILTNEGWKFFKDLKQDEIVATLHPIKKNLEFHKINKKLVYDYNGKMIKIYDKNTDLLVTPNHKFFSQIRIRNNDKNSKDFFVEAKDLKCDYKIPRTINCLKEENKNLFFELPPYSNIKGYKKPKKLIPMEIWVDFMGWFLSEGCVLPKDNLNKTKKGKRVVIVQKKKEGVKKLKILFNKFKNFGFKIIKYSNKNNVKEFVICDTQLGEYLKQFGKCNKKFIPTELKNLPTFYLNILFNSLIEGDGNKLKRKYNKQKFTGSFYYYTTSPKLANDIQEIALRLGMFSQIYIRKKQKENYLDCYRISCYNKKTKNFYLVRKKDLSIVQYNGKVYCVDVSNGIILVRRNGKPIFTGNSKQRGNLPLGIERLIGKLHEEKIDWKFLLRRYITKEIPCDFSYARKNRKSTSLGVYMPSAVKEKIDVGIMIDCSGSIGQKELIDFLSEIVGIARAYKNQINMRLYTHDTKIQNEFLVENGNIAKIMKLKIIGGGGTSFITPYEELIKKNPRLKVLVWVTDGFGDRIEKNKIKNPIIWVLSKNSTDNYVKDLGRVIKLNE